VTSPEREFTAMSRTWRGASAYVISARRLARQCKRELEIPPYLGEEGLTGHTREESCKGQNRSRGREADAEVLNSSPTAPPYASPDSGPQDYNPFPRRVKTQAQMSLSCLFAMAKQTRGLGPLLASALIVGSLTFPTVGAPTRSPSSEDHGEALTRRRNDIIGPTGDALLKYCFQDRLLGEPYHIDYSVVGTTLLAALAHAEAGSLCDLYDIGETNGWAHYVREDIVYKALSTLVTNFLEHQQRKRAKKERKTERRAAKRERRDSEANNRPTSTHPPLPVSVPTSSPLVGYPSMSGPSPPLKKPRLRPPSSGGTNILSSLGPVPTATVLSVTSLGDPPGWAHLDLHGRDTWRPKTRESWAVLQSRMTEYQGSWMVEKMQVETLKTTLATNPDLRFLATYQDRLAQAEQKVQAWDESIVELVPTMQEFMRQSDEVAELEQAATRRQQKKIAEVKELCRTHSTVAPCTTSSDPIQSKRLQDTTPGEGTLAVVPAAVRSDTQRARHEAGKSLTAGVDSRRNPRGSGVHQRSPGPLVFNPSSDPKNGVFACSAGPLNSII